MNECFGKNARLACRYLAFELAIVCFRYDHSVAICELVWTCLVIWNLAAKTCVSGIFIGWKDIQVDTQLMLGPNLCD